MTEVTEIKSSQEYAKVTAWWTDLEEWAAKGQWIIYGDSPSSYWIQGKLVRNVPLDSVDGQKLDKDFEENAIFIKTANSTTAISDWNWKLRGSYCWKDVYLFDTEGEYEKFKQTDQGYLAYTEKRAKETERQLQHPNTEKKTKFNIFSLFKRGKKKQTEK